MNYPSSVLKQSPSPDRSIELAQQVRVGVESGTPALADVRVLDATESAAGAILAMMLGDNGAEVISLDRTRPEYPGNSGTFDTWDRDKRRLSLDIRDSAQHQLLARLVSSADIVLAEPSRKLLPETCGCERTRQANPQVVWCDLGGDRLDPRTELGYATLATAHLGIMGMSPGHRDGPIFPGHPALTYSTAMTALIGVLAALHARLDAGRGRRVEATYTDGMLAIMAMNWWSERGISIFKSRERSGHLDFGRYRQILRIFECSDGGLIQVHTGAAGAFARALTAFGLEHDVTPATGAQQFDTELTDDDILILRDRLPEIIRSRPSGYWLARLWEHDVACLPLLPPGEVLGDEQVAHSGLLAEVSVPHGPPIEALGPLILFSETPARPPGRVHRPGEDTLAIASDGWRAPGLPTHAIEAAPGQERAPLSGITVIDLCSWFAGPYGCRLLADLGARVIKVEPLGGDPIRTMPDPCDGANRGKQSLAVNLKDPRSRGVMQRLFDSVDMVVHNLRPGAAERIGIGYDDTTHGRPTLIYNHAPGYGSTGPKARLQSFAPLLSGFTGVNHMSGGTGNPPNGFFGNEDYYNGMLSATGNLLALIHRDRTGRGQYVETPQLHSSLLFSSEWHIRDQRIDSVLPRLNADQTGFGPGHRIFQCLVGWIAVVCLSADDYRTLVREVTGEDICSGPSALEDDRSPQLLEYSFFGLPAGEWAGRLRSAGLLVEEVLESNWFLDFLHDETNVGTGLVYDLTYPVHGHVRTIGPVFHLSGVPKQPARRAPALGEHTSEILSGAGLSPVVIDELSHLGVVRATATTVHDAVKG